MRSVLWTTLLGGLAMSSALAQTTAPPPTQAPAGKMKSKAATIPAQTPEGIECSKQADAKGLHGQERVRFRANCKLKLAKKKS